MRPSTAVDALDFSQSLRARLLANHNLADLEGGHFIGQQGDRIRGCLLAAAEQREDHAQMLGEGTKRGSRHLGARCGPLPAVLVDEQPRLFGASIGASCALAPAPGDVLAAAREHLEAAMDKLDVYMTSESYAGSPR